VVLSEKTAKTVTPDLLPLTIRSAFAANQATDSTQKAMGEAIGEKD